MKQTEIVARVREIDRQLTQGITELERVSLLRERKDLYTRYKRNKAARQRNQVMRDLGLVKTPHGWE